MKNQILVFTILLVSFLGISQNQDIITKSIVLDDIFPFIITHIDNKNSNVETISDHLTFLIQVPLSGLNTENKVILKQAFKLISDRLSEDDYITIICYSGRNGMILKRTNAKDIKDILYAIENLNSRISNQHQDGIALAYSEAKTHHDDSLKTTIVMIRNPSKDGTLKENNTQVSSLQQVKPPKSGNAVLLTAISLLPQIISVIKD